MALAAWALFDGLEGDVKGGCGKFAVSYGQLLNCGHVCRSLLGQDFLDRGNIALHSDDPGI
jgi:hypothetical protein